MINSDIVHDMAGRPVDCSGPVWRMNTPGAPIELDWSTIAALPTSILEAAQMYVRHKIPLWAPPTIGGLFYMYKLLSECRSFGQDGGALTCATFEELRADGRAGGPELTRYRAWYDWAATLELPGFDRSVSGALNLVRIGTNPQDRPSRKKDPELGPLSDIERYELFEKALDASDEDLPLMERVAVLLGTALGANAGPMSLLQVQDYSVRSSGTTAYHLLEVPRHKKGFEQERTDFRTRPIERRWAPYLEQLITRNRARADEIYLVATGRPKPEHVAIPVFMREQPRTDLEPAMVQYSLHITGNDFSALLRRAADRLKVNSRHGGPLRLNARRLRSTYATNLIADGKSRQVVADALDHSSTKYVASYEFADHRVVDSLDARIGNIMEEVAGGFLGALTEASSEASRGRTPSSRIGFVDRVEDGAKDLGNCGSGETCELAAPLACYTCRNFEPWIEAPHRRLLEQLTAERARRSEAHMHPRIIAVQDRAIRAVAEVVEKIEQTRAAKEPSGQ
ncbi:site-specific integrase [Bradyrhizobium sp. MOS001]|uniref:tyrosine-type recombinase/integrase n=1 Tax=Bradyrhizobium sp. MOS001 TaxID=2133948 RepID=UPI0010755260|nr:tyrosine-type recombinase/integrase [Bradyrhizobium sp. MOS001]TFW55932.1 site-specific integrase [Bradyrhizobium sp. MOS001]